MNMAPGYFRKKIEENGKKRNLSLFDSLPTCCISLATGNLSDNHVL